MSHAVENISIDLSQWLPAPPALEAFDMPALGSAAGSRLPQRVGAPSAPIAVVAPRAAAADIATATNRLTVTNPFTMPEPPYSREIHLGDRVGAALSAESAPSAVGFAEAPPVAIPDRTSSRLGFGEAFSHDASPDDRPPTPALRTLAMPLTPAQDNFHGQLQEIFDAAYRVAYRLLGSRGCAIDVASVAVHRTNELNPEHPIAHAVGLAVTEAIDYPANPANVDHAQHRLRLRRECRRYKLGDRTILGLRHLADHTPTGVSLLTGIDEDRVRTVTARWVPTDAISGSAAMLAAIDNWIGDGLVVHETPSDTTLLEHLDGEPHGLTLTSIHQVAPRFTQPATSSKEPSGKMRFRAR